MNNKLTNNTKNTTKIGLRAERLACSWLESKGLVLIERNVRTRFFELDIIMQDDETIVFCEVKYRASQFYGGGVGAMTHDKQRRLSIGAMCWLMEQGKWEHPVRFDVIEVIGVGPTVKIIHHADCFVAEMR